MPKNIYERKDSSLNFRVSECEYRKLKQLARESYLSVSEYLRRRIYEEILNKLPEEDQDNKPKFSCDHDREMMRLAIRTFLYSKHLSQKTLDKSIYEKCNALAIEQLKEWGYEK